MIEQVLPGDPAQGDAQGMTSYAQSLRLEADQCAERAKHVRAAAGVLGEMRAKSVDALAEQVSEASTRLTQLAEGYGEAARIHGEYAEEVNQIQQASRRVAMECGEAIRQAQHYSSVTATQAPQAAIYSSSWMDVPPAFALLADAHYARHRWAGAVGQIEDYRQQWNALTMRRLEADTITSRRLEQIDVIKAIDSAVPGVALGAGGGIAASLWAGDDVGITAAGLAALGSAGLVRQVWDRLSPAQRAQLVGSAPGIIGNLDGIPLKYRADANRISIRDEITRLEARLAEIDADLDHPPGWHAMSGSSKHQDLVGERREILDAIAAYQAYLKVPEDTRRFWYDAYGNQRPADRVHVIAFDPEKSSLGTYHGMFDDDGDIPGWVGNVVVHVPGTFTNMTSFSGTDDRAFDLYRGAHDVKRGADPTAIIAWGGGEFPQSIPGAMADTFADDMAPRLRDFTAAIDTHPGTSTLTVTGHSYGAAVVGKSEQVGLAADRVLYMAPAGMGSGFEDVSEFAGTSDAAHYTMLARNDAVVGAIHYTPLEPFVHGPSQLKTDGVTRLETGFIEDGNQDSGALESVGPTEVHSEVYSPGSTAFENAVNVFVGGEVSTFAPDTRVLDMKVPGILADDYEPEYLDVE